MFILYSIILVILSFIIFEYRIRRPDHIALYESRGHVRRRKMRFYPRHFSLCIPGTVHSVLEEVEAEAKGHLLVKVKLTIAVAASTDNLPALIQIGSWDEGTVPGAAKELKVKMDALTREFTGIISIFWLFSDFYPLKLVENIVFFYEFPKKLTGNFI